MKKPVLIEFNTGAALRGFKKDQELINCAIVENTLACHLDEMQIRNLSLYGGKLVEDAEEAIVLAG